MAKRALPILAITHSGVFHADDVFAYSFLEIINPSIRLKRLPKITDDLISDSGTVIFDIGGGEFDHHQGKFYRKPEEEEAPLASFGLVVRRYWDHIDGFTFPMYKMFDRDLVQPVDMQDAMGNLGHNIPSTLSQAIASFNPSWNEENDEAAFLEAFYLASKFAKIIIGNYIARVEASILAEEFVRNAAQDPYTKELKAVFLPKFMPYGTIPHEYGANWVVYPSMRGGIQIFSASSAQIRNLQLIPDGMIAELETDPDCTFVHKGGFTAVFTSTAAVMRTLKKLAGLASTD